MKIRVGNLISSSFVDGPGERRVVLLQGCSIKCPGCQSENLWDRNGGSDIAINYLVYWLSLTEHKNVTVSGGEPFLQAFPLAYLCLQLKKKGCHVTLYTGYTWEHVKEFLDVLKNVDILVDGPFIQSKDDDLITYRGSRNQRPIDVQESLRTNRTILLDWDAPELVITPDGNVFIPDGLVSKLKGLGDVEPTRMCGEQPPEVH